MAFRISYMTYVAKLQVCGTWPFNRIAQRVLGTVMGETFPNQNMNSQYRNPTVYSTGT